MYRFPVCGSCAVRRTFRNRSLWSSIAAKCKHTSSSADQPIDLMVQEVRPHTSPAVQNQWFPLRVSNEISEDFRSRPKYIGTFDDDFGFLSLAGSSDSGSVSGEPNLLEQLLRSESTSTVSDWSSVHVPTTVDTSEIGGLVETGGLEQCLEGLLGEGYDVSAMLTDLHDSVTERQQGVAAIPCGSSTVPLKPEVTSSEFISRPVFPTRTRQLITDQMRRDMRKQEHRTVSSVVPVIGLGAGSMAFFPSKSESTNPATDAHPSVPFVEPQATSSFKSPASKDIEMKTRFDPDLSRVEYATNEELSKVVNSKDIQNLRALLNIKRWPLNSGIQASNALMLAVEKSEDCEEATMFMRDFATSGPRTWVRDFVAVTLACRVAKELGPEEAAQQLQIHRDIFMARPPTDRRSDNRLSTAFSELFSIVAQRGNVTHCQQIVDCAIKCGYSVDESKFVGDVMASFGNQGIPFPHLFATWKDLSSRYLTIRGIDILLEKALTESKDSRIQAKRIGDILSYCSRSEHPFSVIAELLCVFIKLDKMDEAFALFSRVSISGRHLKGPLGRLQQCPGSLIYVQRLAELITRCMYAERRRGGKKKNITSSEEIQSSVEPPQSQSTVSEALMRVLNDFCGIGMSRKKLSKSQKDKIKKHKVNEEELHELAEHIQSVWILLAGNNNDMAAVERLQLWCATNRIDIPDKILKKIEHLQSEKTSKSIDN